MPLKYDLEIASGVTVKHWVIRDIKIDFENKIMEFAFHGYITKAAKQTGKVPQIRQNRMIDGADFTITDQDD